MNTDQHLPTALYISYRSLLLVLTDVVIHIQLLELNVVCLGVYGRKRWAWPFDAGCLMLRARARACNIEQLLPERRIHPQSSDAPTNINTQFLLQSVSECVCAGACACMMFDTDQCHAHLNSLRCVCVCACARFHKILYAIFVLCVCIEHHV